MFLLSLVHQMLILVISISVTVGISVAWGDWKLMINIVAIAQEKDQLIA